MSKSTRARSTTSGATARAKPPRARAKRSPKPAVLGQRVGTKKSDTRWQDEEGTIWASRFEYQVYVALREHGYAVRRTNGDDSMRYTVDVRGAKCSKCDSSCVVQERTYTPDLFVSQRDTASPGYYVEAKGYIRAEKRRLLRGFVGTRKDIDLRFIVQRDYPVGKSTLVEWARKYLKIPVHVWDGDIPEDWK